MLAKVAWVEVLGCFVPKIACFAKNLVESRFSAESIYLYVKTLCKMFFRILKLELYLF